MVKVARIVTNLVDVRRHVANNAIVLLEIDHQIRGSPFANLGESFAILGIVNGYANEIGPGLAQILGLLDGRVDILRVGRAHALNGNRRATADFDVANANR
jgi:hypothetical protein